MRIALEIGTQVAGVVGGCFIANYFFIPRITAQRPIPKRKIYTFEVLGGLGVLCGSFGLHAIGVAYRIPALGVRW
jgi:hypothetical protein